MPIRAQCDNCGKVYNLPDESAGKRLRCKQCAVAFTVPAAPVAAAVPNQVSASAPTSGPQKICVVCKQDVSGRPRTKDNSGNYYCRSCYEEKARAQQQLAASRVGAPMPAGVGGGNDGGGDEDMIDLAALEPTEQFDESTQPPPPPIPDMDYIAPPIPDTEEAVLAEPVMMETPKPKKKKGPVAGGKAGKSKAAKSTGGDSFASKLSAFPIELWLIGVAVLLGIIGLASSSASGFAFMGLVVIGVGCMLWGQICILITAFAEGTMTGIMYIFLPFYWLIFLLGHWADVQRHVLRVVLGVALMIGGGIVMAHHGNKGDGDEDERPRISSRNNDSTRAGADDEASAPGNQTPTANNQPSATKPAPAVAEPPAEENIRVGVGFKQMLPNGQVIDYFFGDPDEIDKKKEAIEDAILTSLEQRGIKPAEGQYYAIEAVVEENRSSVQKIKMINGDELPAPILICKMRVKSSVGRGSYIFDKAKDVELPADVVTRASRSKLTRFREVTFMDEALWKDLPREFKALADQFKPEVAAAPGDANIPAKAAAPSETPAPAK
jgi:hypothetical protein